MTQPTPGPHPQCHSHRKCCGTTQADCWFPYKANRSMNTLPLFFFFFLPTLTFSALFCSAFPGGENRTVCRITSEDTVVAPLCITDLNCRFRSAVVPSKQMRSGKVNLYGALPLISLLSQGICTAHSILRVNS